MPMTLVVTRDVPERFRGFLASCMLEVAPCVYLAPRMDRAVRQRILDIFDDWSVLLEERGGLIMLWHAPSEPAGVQLRTLGDPPHELCLELQVWLSRRALPESLRDDPDLAAPPSPLRDEDDPPWSLPPPPVPWDEEPPPSSL